MKRLFPLLFLLASPAYAAPPLANWTLPTLNTDGSAIPASGTNNGALVSSRLSYGTCNGAAFGTKIADVVVPVPTTTYSFTQITTPGTYCFVVYILNNEGNESDVSNVATKIVVPVKPNPGVLTVAKNAYQKQGAKIVLVGSIPLNVHCGLDANCKAPWGVELFNVPRARVKFAPHKDNGSQPMGVCA